MADVYITRAQIASFFNNNQSTCDDMRMAILEGILNGEMTVEEVRGWVLENNKRIN